jgi:hypothetical protein
MGYNPGSPEFKDGYLNYKVAGMHYAPDGKTLNLGSYDLLIQPDAARCLYGFSKAPVSATISVIGENTGAVATTLVSESAEWIKLSAYGFNFSAPVIREKLLLKQKMKLQRQMSSGNQFQFSVLKGKR